VSGQATVSVGYSFKTTTGTFAARNSSYTPETYVASIPLPMQSLPNAKQLPRSPLDVFPEIVEVRGQRVLLDETLAELYGVSTRTFNQAVRRNRQRFPSDFLLEVDAEEWEILRSQIVTLSLRRGQHRKYLPLAFTEHGAIMAATILNSPRAIQMSVYVVRAFVRFRHSLSTNKDLARELDVLKRSVATLDSDTRRQFDVVYEAILGLMAPARQQ
jgi:hypothetical protein